MTRTPTITITSQRALGVVVGTIAALAIAIGMMLFAGQPSQALADDDLAAGDLVAQVTFHAVGVPLVDHGPEGGPDENRDMKPSDYSVSTNFDSSTNVGTVTVTATGLQQHYNGEHLLAYWIGIGIPYSEGDTFAYGFGDCPENPSFSADNKTAIMTSGSGTYATFYWGTYSTFKDKTGYVAMKHGDTVRVLNVSFENTSCQHRIDTQAVAGGTCDVPSAANDGDSVKLSATPNEGYELDSWTVKMTNGDDVVTVTNNSFTMPGFDVTVSPKFKRSDVTTDEETGVSAEGGVFDEKPEGVESLALSVTQTEDEDEIATLTEDYAKQIGTNEVAGVYEVDLTAWRADGTSFEITEGVGSMTLSLPVDAEDDTAAKVIQLHEKEGSDEPEVIVHDNLKVADKAVAVPLDDKLSTFIVTTSTEEPDPAVGKEPMYRLYNPNSGEHFYTASEKERDATEAAGWTYEGVGWTAPTTGDPVYRLYNPNAGDHHYTLSIEEKDALVSVGWKYEAIGWCSAWKDGVPLYREYNPNADTGTHNYTTSKEENDVLVSLGWIYEGIGWYGV